MNTRKYVYSFAAVVILAIAAYFIFFRNSKNEFITVRVKYGKFPIEVTTTGELVAKSSEQVRGPQNLRQVVQTNTIKILEIVPEGTVVDSGGYIATLDNTEIMNKIKDEKTNLEKSENEVLKTQLDTSQDLQKARDDLLNLKFMLEEKQIALQQTEFEAPAIKRQAQIDLEKAERSLAQMKNNYVLMHKKDKANMQVATASLNQAKNKLQQFNDLLKEIIITAPKKGMVIYHRGWDGTKQRSGSVMYVWENIVAEFPDLSQMVSKTYVNEIDISKVKKGQPVKIGIDAFPEKKFTGTVTEVANMGEQMQNSNAKVFEVSIQINESDPILRPSMTTKNTILTSEINDVIFIPVEGIFNNDSISYVFLKSGSRIVKKQVINGQSNENEIIIRDGLNVNDEILLSQPENPEDIKMVMIPPEELKKYRDTTESRQVTKGKTLKPDQIIQIKK